MPNEKYNKLSKKFVEEKPALSQKIKVSSKLDIQAYKSHSLPLKIMMAKEFMKKMTTTNMINPYLSESTADTGAQVIILGHNHNHRIGLNIPCLHRTEMVLDCANASATGAMGVFFGCIRGKSMVTGKTLVHRGMVNMTEGDIFLLSQTALKDLGVIPMTFPRIGEFGGEEQCGDGQDRFEVDAKFNLRYIATETVPQLDVVQDQPMGEQHHGP